MGLLSVLFILVALYLLYSHAERPTLVMKKDDFCDRPNQVKQRQPCSMKCRNYGAECVLPAINGCDCIQDFAVDSTNTCISIHACIQHDKHICVGHHMEYRCDYSCNNECYGVDFLRSSCPPDEECLMGCYCKEGYLRQLDGSCVLAENCPRIVLKEEERKLNRI